MKLEFYTNFLTARGFSPHTVSAYLKDAELYLRYLEQKKMELNHSDSLGKYLSSLYKDEPATVERKRSALLCFYEFLSRSGNNFMPDREQIAIPKKPLKLPNFFSEKELAELLSNLDPADPFHTRNRLLLAMLYSTGLRISEVMSVTMKNINLKEGSIKVLGKGSKERLVFLTASVLQELKIYVQLHKAEIEQKQCLFFSANGKPLSVRGAQHILKQIGLKQQSLKRINAHAFRHSFATHLLQNGADIRKVSELLGHASLATTQKYTHLDRKVLKAAYLKAHPHS